MSEVGAAFVRSLYDQGDDKVFSYRNYEINHQLRLSRFFKILRISYVAFCLLLIFLAQGYLQTGWGDLTVLVVFTVAYTLFRLFKPASIFHKKRLAKHLLLDSTDFLLVTVLVYLTGGVHSYFLAAYSIPVLACTIRYGLLHGFASLLVSIGLGFIASFLGNSFPLPLIFHLLSICGILAFAIWTVSIVIGNEMRMREKLYTSSVTDQLTGLYHRGYACERINEEIMRQMREKGHFAIVFIDLDDFKKVNDRYGHLVGDDILKHTAGVLKETVRGGETLTRYGGDEFLLLMPGARRKDAEQVLKRLREAVCGKPYHLLSVPIRLGISGGTAEYPSDGGNLEQLLRIADQNMYREKS